MEDRKNDRPNFLIIMSDDQGFSDLSCYGSEIQTPHIDSLAQQGTRFTDFHASAACSPTRAMLLTGTDHHLTGLGQMAEFLMDSKVHQGKPGHEGFLNDKVATLPEVLRHAGGYHTIMSGKWHLGLEPQHSPQARGFDRSFALLPPAANHYAWDPVAYTEDVKLPKFARVNVAALHIEDGQYVDNDTLPENFYSSDFYTDKLIDYLNQRPKAKPFFAYLPFSAPHWPLQAPKESIAKYKGAYNDGPEALRQRRIKSLKQLGLVPNDVKPHPVIAPEVPEWHKMTDEQRQKSAKSMEAYSGMVDRMDFNVGRIIEYLKDNEIYDNTQIIFMSDNGAEGFSYEAHPLTGRDVVGYVGKYYDNSLVNIGSKTSFVWYGGRWAQAATAPSRLYKKYSTEGGIRVPFILKPSTALPFRTSMCHEFCTVQDLMPTFLEQAGIEKPEGSFNGRSIEPIRGTSWLPFLENKLDQPHPDDYVAGWELFGQAALRKGPWKLNYVNKPFGSEKWELHNLVKDPGETHDVSEQFPDKKAELLTHWEEYAKQVGVVGLKTQLPEVARRDAMEDPTAWMPFETSRSISVKLKRGLV